MLDLGLEERDRLRLEAFLAIGSEQLKGRWVVADHYPADAAIAHEDAVSAAANPPVALLRLCQHATGQEEPNSLRLRVPLQFEDLVRALAAVELRLGAVGREAPPVPAPALVAASAPEPLLVPAPRTVPSAVASRKFEPLPVRLMVGHRFRLRRWPNVFVLNAHPDGRRISPFMSSRALTLSELARLSGIPQARCSEFLAFLMTANFLHVEPLVGEMPGAPPAAPDTSRASAAGGGAAASAASTPTLPPRQGKSLLSRLRERLGLTATMHSDRN